MTERTIVIHESGDVEWNVEHGEEIHPGMVITAQDRYDQAYYQAMADSEAERMTNPTNHERQAQGDMYGGSFGGSLLILALVFLAGAGLFFLIAGVLMPQVTPWP